MTTKEKGVSSLQVETLWIDDEEWERTNFGVVTKEKMGSSYKSFTHGELAELAILSGLTEFLDSLSYQLRKRGVP
jgi:hypothetical protein